MAVNPFSGLARFFGSAVSEGAAFAMGAAMSPALGPLVQDIVNEARSQHRVYPIATLDAAMLVAEGLYDAAHGDEVAAAHGIGAEPFSDLVALSRQAPAVALALTLWRRGEITEALMDHALAKARIIPEYRDAVKALFVERLEVATVARAVQRGVMKNDGLLPVGPPTGRGVIEPMPVSELDPVLEAAASGYDRERLAVEARIVGLPPAPGELLELVNRQIIEEIDYYRGIAEGNTRNEWAKVLLELRHPVLSASTYATAHLKGWIEAPAMVAGGELTGHTAEQMDLLFKVAGRPAAPVQMFTAVARKIDGPLGRPMDLEQFLKAVKESDIRPEYGPMLWGIRYAYPPLFQINRLVQAGDATPAEGVDWATKDRYAPEVIAALSRTWNRAGAGGVKTETEAMLRDEYEGLFISAGEFTAALELLGYSPAAAALHVEIADARRIKAARDDTIKAIRKSFLSHAIELDEAGALLADERIAAAAQSRLLEEWDKERNATHATLTKAQIKSAYKKGNIDQGTAISELEDRGLSTADATLYLGS